MATLQQLRSGLNRAWGSLAEGWRNLQQSASHALTRFNPTLKKGDEYAEQALMRSPAWGILAAEISEDDDQLNVRLEAPGMESGDFDIQVINDTLVIRGEKHSEKSTHKDHYHIMECAYGSFERAIPLPAAVDEGRANARYRRGVLHITLPKHPLDKRKRIEIKEGK